jgi:hypothetical protein
VPVPLPPMSTTPHVHLSSPDSTRPVEGLRHSSTSRTVGGSSNTHKHTMARKIVVYSCTHAFACRASRAPLRLSRTERAPLSARPCVVSPPSVPAPSRPSPCKLSPIVGIACSARLEHWPTNRLQKRSAGRFPRYLNARGTRCSPIVLSFHSCVTVT